MGKEHKGELALEISKEKGDTFSLFSHVSWLIWDPHPQCVACAKKIKIEQFEASETEETFTQTLYADKPVDFGRGKDQDLRGQKHALTTDYNPYQSPSCLLLSIISLSVSNTRNLKSHILLVRLNLLAAIGMRENSTSAQTNPAV